MQTEYFQGKDGYIWWHGVVEDRKDPLFLGRCRVRILGWHTENKSELPTEFLPWAQALMPITSASQTGVGQAPVGPVEGTWVMGFYRDGELAQEPVMVGTLPGIPERFARQNTGFYDSRLDDSNTDRNSVAEDGTPIVSGSEKNLQSYPYPPKQLSYVSGSSATVTNYTHNERIAIDDSQSLYPRQINKPTTSMYARGKNDSSANVGSASSIITHKNLNVLSETISVTHRPNKAVSGELRDGTSYFSDSASFFTNDIIKNIAEPLSPYDAKYPFNHVYESESGHLVEIDDTPEAERLHWYHRSGTFTEFHPDGDRVDRTVGHRYTMTTGNQETITMGDSLQSVQRDKFVDVGGKLSLTSGLDINLISSAGNVTVDSSSLNTTISGKNVIIAAADTLVLKGGTKIVRDDDKAADLVKGDYDLNVQGGHSINSGKLNLGSMGATSISSFGPITQTVTGSSEETIANVDVLFGNLNAKKITALLGKIVLEAIEPSSTGGIDLNLGPFGAVGAIQILPGGLILLRSSAGTISLVSGSATSITAAGAASLVGAAATTVGSSATPITSVDGALVTIGGTSSPALLAKDFLKLFAEHTHPTSVGPTGPLSPQFASKLIQTMSKKVFLS